MSPRTCVEILIRFGDDTTESVYVYADSYDRHNHEDSPEEEEV